MSQTIKTILDEMKFTVEKGQIQSPTWWIDGAMKLAVLRQDLQEKMCEAEIKYRNEVLELVKIDTPNAKAENMIKGRPLRDGEKMTSYQFYNYLKGRDKVVEEIIRIAKKRATLEETF